MSVLQGVHDIMKETVYLCMGRQLSNESSESNVKYPEGNKSTLPSETSSTPNSEITVDSSLLTSSECNKILTELKELLIAVCDYSHDECAKVLTTLAKSKTSKERNLKAGDRSAMNGTSSAFENFSAKQIYKLSKIIENFTFECEKISSKSPTSLKGAFQFQANKFMNKFHNERKDRLSIMLEKETWTPAEVEPTFQNYLNDIINNKMISGAIFDSTINGKPELYLTINDEKYAIVG